MNVREWALPVYTILMQLATGALFCLWMIRTTNSSKYGFRRIDQFITGPLLIIFSTIILAMIGSHFHLSKPYLSFLAMSNFRSSWLSREIAFTSFGFLCTLFLVLMLRYGKEKYWLKSILGWGAILAGFATVYCMASIYLLPTQIAWNSSVTILSYYGVMFLLGTTSLIVILLMNLRFVERNTPEYLETRLQITERSILWLTVGAALAATLVIVLGFYKIEFLRSLDDPSAQASLQLMLTLYKPLLVIRIGLTVIGVAWLVVVVTYFIHRKRSFTKLLWPVYLACVMVLIGEILERFLFYATHVRIGI